MTKGSALALASGIACMLHTRSAVAESARRMDLRWARDDASCLREEALAASVEAVLGRAVFHTNAETRGTVAGEVGAQSPRGYAARVILRGSDGSTIAERRLETLGECARLDEAIALVVALMIDDLEETPPAAQIPVEAPRAPPPAPSRPLARPTPPPPKRTTLDVGLGAGAAAGLTHDVTPAAILRAEVGVPLVPLAVGARFFETTTSADGAGEGGRFDLWSAEIAICPARIFSDRVRVGLCAGGGAGAMTGTPVGLLGGGTRVRPIAFVTAAPFFALRIVEPFWLRAEAGVMIPLLREPWGFVDGRGAYVEVERMAAIAPILSAFFEVHADFITPGDAGHEP